MKPPFLATATPLLSPFSLICTDLSDPQWHDGDSLWHHSFSLSFPLRLKLQTLIYTGSTDPLIIIMVLEHHGISREQALARLPEVEKVMVDHFLANSATAAEGIEILPGVAEVLQRLQVRG
jgi:hypothetical protein